ncbi:MAG: excinuclease ABC subunit A [Crocinitomicaceae bacterium]|nr:excinuclease ABC subunit A [Crocinitomicaceae bacterium]|tara:strand:+ start:89149 stop:91956 length:2808 start_codon:yes stop_codon:yes gene_type:complete
MKKKSFIIISGARTHNLKNFDLKIPRNQLVVFTGLSGSGKSSLAFDTIFAEGQRRYIETFSSYARQFLGGLERPDVDKIEGLSPVISIEQKTLSKSPRSTVGTITEVYDLMRLLFSRVSTAYSYNTGEAMIKYSDNKIVDLIIDNYFGKKVIILSPKINARKGHYRELFEQILKNGFTKVFVDGDFRDIVKDMKLDRYKIHDIDIVIDRLQIDNKYRKRIYQSVVTAMKHGDKSLKIFDVESGDFRHFSRSLMCPSTGISYPDPEPNLFSFNSPYGACKLCSGIGEISEVDLNKIVPDFSKSIKEGGLLPLGQYKKTWIFDQLEKYLTRQGLSIETPISEISSEVLNVILNGNDGIERSLKDDTFIFEGIINFILRHSEGNSIRIKRWANSFLNRKKCSSCQGYRIKKEALHFKIGDKHIGNLSQMDISDLEKWFDKIENYLDDTNQIIAVDILKEIKVRLSFIIEVGLTYLSLNRSAKTLSGGESQRIRLVTQIGGELMNVLYIMDEPSIGLHPRDNIRLINSLKRIRDIGNSVIVVEHDKEMIESADFLVDLGPGAGVNGGYIVNASKNFKANNGRSLTSQYLTGKKSINIPKKRRKGSGNKLILKGACGRNLRSVDLSIPLGTITCITGVSGSGKSSLINHTLYPILLQEIYNGVKKPLPFKSISGIQYLDKVIEIDQSPIGRTPRSNPATYTKLFDEIRLLFSNLPTSKIRGYKPGRFSFNIKGGRCEICKGAGVKIIEMHLLPDVTVECETCNGKRYNNETNEILYKDKSISDVLDMTISDAAVFFNNNPKISFILETLISVGLGYIKLGQSSTTLSGGEAQRIKLSSELSKKATGNTMYILDEPSTGLHFEDIKMLLILLNKLVEEGNTILIIEHNLDIIKVADHIIDLGPEGGKNGGNIICSGTPEFIVNNFKKTSYTAMYLEQELKN